MPVDAHATSSGVVFTLQRQRDDQGDSWPTVECLNGSIVIGPPRGIGWHGEPMRPEFARGYEVFPDSSGKILVRITYPECHSTQRVVINGTEYTGPVVFPETVQTIDLPAWCAADYLCTGFASGDSLDAFARDWESGNPNADFLQTGFVNADSMDAFATAWLAGCPAKP